eukprot:4324919-Pyramimonas_sp.AAC.1
MIIDTSNMVEHPMSIVLASMLNAPTMRYINQQPVQLITLMGVRLDPCAFLRQRKIACMWQTYQ